MQQKLSGKYQRNSEYPASSRMTMRPEPYLQLAHNDRVFDALDRLQEFAAAAHHVSMAAISLRWLLQHPLGAHCCD